MLVLLSSQLINFKGSLVQKQMIYHPKYTSLNKYAQMTFAFYLFSFSFLQHRLLLSLNRGFPLPIAAP